MKDSKKNYLTARTLIREIAYYKDIFLNCQISVKKRVCSMNEGTTLHNDLVRVLVKLWTLKNSCTGIATTRQYPPDVNWFENAGTICQEPFDRIREVLDFLERPEDGRPASLII